MELNVAVACPDSTCGSELRVDEKRADKIAPSSELFRGVCSSCAKIFTVEITPIVRIREGDGPFQDVPAEGVRL